MLLPEKFLTCVRCEDGLKREEGQTPVPGEGISNAEVMLIGESPGAEEMKNARPFVGKAGENLNDFLKSVGLNRNNMYVANTTRCRPYKVTEKILKNGTKRITKSNKPPSQHAIRSCATWLDMEIDLVNPKLIVTLGSTPLKRLLPEHSISKVHGTLLTVPIQRAGIKEESREFTLSEQEFHLFPLYHPAAIIYRRELQEVFEEDLKKLRQAVEKLQLNSVLVQ
ncbi:uracil-DNA glycosylase [Aneurinibacillus aneurinilyticus]|jgi:DNA polymerase|uniref:Uracil-DNA glycosylase n=2 Tax=Aneurinibacillus aneurinilyticus TaxID=1391 RepID=A0A848D1K5_ANEAE|nr:uracil-DNA glycosylase [Aneurinibacillus aneurinilyticus]ERI05324.1 uracil-DNA glycosylase, family 4 [Aneurinibacillus aneurinilyticus ATCC 12856]MCI1696249.1 uracil-DNA glycosylase [Aneurinibacillus aneurinilyticus]MED0670532.1 uracil-DNA glycosylase [Aneurinibacillus aneurinilyticus]MED0704861.1 uracil-DNA glycosylase [Aneurinibacillus aneurinilyticus]MED0724097.1 uracil-DNA glycosylase [Aneurinibacillus aneurinilyticus]